MRSLTAFHGKRAPYAHGDPVADRKFRRAIDQPKACVGYVDRRGRFVVRTFDRMISQEESDRWCDEGAIFVFGPWDEDAEEAVRFNIIPVPSERSDG